MTARAVGGREEMCERKASSDLMSVMVDMMRVVALWGKVEYGDVKCKRIYEERLSILDCATRRNYWGKQLSCHKGWSQEKLRACTVVRSLIAVSAGKEINFNVPMTRDSRPPRIGVIIYAASAIKIT